MCRSLLQANDPPYRMVVCSGSWLLVQRRRPVRTCSFVLATGLSVFFSCFFAVFCFLLKDFQMERSTKGWLRHAHSKLCTFTTHSPPILTTHSSPGSSTGRSTTSASARPFYSCAPEQMLMQFTLTQHFAPFAGVSIYSVHKTVR